MATMTNLHCNTLCSNVVISVRALIIPLRSIIRICIVSFWCRGGLMGWSGEQCLRFPHCWVPNFAQRAVCHLCVLYSSSCSQDVRYFSFDNHVVSLRRESCQPTNTTFESLSSLVALHSHPSLVLPYVQRARVQVQTLLFVQLRSFSCDLSWSNRVRVRVGSTSLVPRPLFLFPLPSVWKRKSGLGTRLRVNRLGGGENPDHHD